MFGFRKKQSEFVHADLLQFSWDARKGLVDLLTVPLVGTQRGSGRRYWLGRYRILVKYHYLGVEPGWCQVTIRNRDTRGLPVHPDFHYADLGCLGNMRPILESALAQRDWLTLTDYLLSFVRTIRTVGVFESTGRRWPEIAEDDETGIGNQERASLPVGGIDEYTEAVAGRLDTWLPVESIRGWRVVIIGLGVIGSRLALAIAKLGFRDLWLFDPDRVEYVNVPIQQYAQHQRGCLKVEALARALEGYPCASTLVTRATRFESDPILTRSKGRATIYLTGVDSLAARRQIWSVLKHTRGCRLLIDGRLQGSLGDVFVVRSNDQASRHHYEQYGFQEPSEGSNLCGMNAYTPAAAQVESLMLDQLHAFMNGERTFHQRRFDLKLFRVGMSPYLIEVG